MEGPPAPPPPPAVHQGGGPQLWPPHDAPPALYASQLAMNGSQPCLMIPEGPQVHHQHDLFSSDPYYGPSGQSFIDATCGGIGSLPPPPPLIERQRSLPRSSMRRSNQHQHNYQSQYLAQQHQPPPLQPPLSHKGM